MENTAPVFEKSRENTKFLASVLGIMGLALVWTALVAFGVAYGLAYIIVQDVDAGMWTLIGLMVFSVVGLIAFAIASPFILRNGRGGAVVLSVYSTLMGVIFSLFVIFMDPLILGEAILITAIAFFSMFLVGYLFPVSIGLLGMVALGFIFGAFLMAISGSISYFVFGYGTALDFVVASCLLVAICLLTAIDGRKMKNYAVSGGGYDHKFICAYVLYGDFVTILMYVLRILIAIAGSKR